MKRTIAVIVCAAVIITLLAVSSVPAAAASETNSFSVTGATVDYTAIAWYSSGKIRGYVYAHVETRWYSSAGVTIGAGVRWDGYTFASDTALLETSGAWGSDSDTVSIWASYSLGSPMDVALRIVVLSQTIFSIPLDADARCWTWEYNDPSLTRDTVAETTWTNYAIASGLTMLLANFMGPYL